MKSDFHRLALKERLRETRKWVIIMCLFNLERIDFQSIFVGTGTGIFPPCKISKTEQE